MENEDMKVGLGTTSIVYLSLLCLKVEEMPIIPCSNFASPLIIRAIDRMHDYICVLFSTNPDESCTITNFPLLWQKIISGEVRWGLALKIFGEFYFIMKYWEWVEHILTCFESQLRTCCLIDAVCASLYTCDCDPHVVHTFCVAWCPKTNSLHIIHGEISISLWDLYELSGLPIYGQIYDEAGLVKMHYINIVSPIRD